MDDENKNRFKLFFLILLVFLFLILIFIFKKFDLFDINNLKNLVNSFGFWAPIIFILIYVFITIFGFSAAALTILAGLIFGVWKGLIVVVIGATLSGTIAFYIARILRNNFFSNKKLNSNLIQKLSDRIEKTCKKNGFLTIAILRLSFMPYIPLSYAAGLVQNLKAKDFILATLLTNIFGSFVFIYLGNSITQSIPIFILAMILLLLFIQIPKLLDKIKNRF
jgi:uncharacterized membrane protein YdjX (TVP38/TMEM64 family)